VSQLEKDPTKTHTIFQICDRYAITRRRLYDVINVFVAIGCVTRTGAEEFRWEGIQPVLPHLIEEKRKLQITKYNITLSQLFPPDVLAGLGALTVSFLMLFPATSTNPISLREASAFFSRGSHRNKITLCRLYQITLILGVIEITERTKIQCQVRLKAPYDELMVDMDEDNPFLIRNLLNRVRTKEEELEARREEFRTAGASSNGSE
jgi:hypothetical protein